MEKRKHTVREMQFTAHETCAFCGKKLPVEVIDVGSTASLAVFCKHCKTVTIIDIRNKS